MGRKTVAVILLLFRGSGKWPLPPSPSYAEKIRSLIGIEPDLEQF